MLQTLPQFLKVGVLHISKYFYVQMCKNLNWHLFFIHIPETYINSPDYLNSYPHDYEQVNMV